MLAFFKLSCFRLNHVFYFSCPVNVFNFLTLLFNIDQEWYITLQPCALDIFLRYFTANATTVSINCINLMTEAEQFCTRNIANFDTFANSNDFLQVSSQ